MLIREVLPKEKEDFNTCVDHPLQSWEWGEFRQRSGKKVIRIGGYDPGVGGKDQAKLRTGYQLTVHPIPHTNHCILYFPRGPMPDKNMIETLKKLGEKENAILIKMEPNVKAPFVDGPATTSHQEINKFLTNNNCRPGQSFFYDYTFQIDLTKDENELLADMNSKTRYNIRLSQRHGVSVVVDNSNHAFQEYLRLMDRTTKRQKFFAHTPEYHQKMWETLSEAGIAHLMCARYQGITLGTWILFLFNNVLYYPYGASSRENQQVMPTYALMWEAIKFGQVKKCHTFDLWGCLGPKPNPLHPWYGFHRFKAGFGGQLMKFLGTYDYVINFSLYPFYNLANNVRWKLLNLKNRLGL